MTEARPYHHGNLRESLIDAALDVVERLGHQAVSLRELAQALEVSRGAPYRHFADREALLKAVAVRGFEQLLQAQADIAQAQPDKHRRVADAGRSFLAFTEAHPRLFMLMFDSTLLDQAPEDDELAASLQANYQAVGLTVGAVMAGASEDRVRLTLITLWSTLYGFARLRLESNLKPYMYGNLSRQDVEEAIIAAAFPIAP